MTTLAVTPTPAVDVLTEELLKQLTATAGNAPEQVNYDEVTARCKLGVNTTDEVRSAQVRRKYDMVRQKLGLIPVQLTKPEQNLIYRESLLLRKRPNYWEEWYANQQ
jgi:hypothetical protein